MVLPDVFMIAGDTSRSRCYLQALCAKNLFPRCIAFLPSTGDRPGQITTADGMLKSVGTSWGEFNPSLPLAKSISHYNLPRVDLPSGDINATETIAQLKTIPEATAVFSGFGGVLLRDEVLGIGKRFLHVHGGWLPKYKGSTTNHFSALEKGFCGASAIFLSSSLDQGVILERKKFPVPQEPLLLDHVYDAVYRADVLCSVIEHYVAHGEWPSANVENRGTVPYYIMHPVLRHILILNTPMAAQSARPRGSLKPTPAAH